MPSFGVGCGRAAGRVFGIDRRTVEKMLRLSVPPGYRRKKPVRRPKLDPFVEIIDQILAEDSGRPKKQRHTSKRIFERLRDERGYVNRNENVIAVGNSGTGKTHVALALGLAAWSPFWMEMSGGLTILLFPSPARGIWRSISA